MISYGGEIKQTTAKFSGRALEGDGSEQAWQLHF